MKKTLITLLAVASCAMGSTTWTSYEVAETVTTTGFDFSTNAVTVAVTLNVDVIKEYFNATVGTSNFVIKVTGNNAIGVGTLVKNNTQEYFSAAWNNTIDYTPSGVDQDMGREDLWEGATNASLVFSADRGTGARVVFTMNYSDGSVFQSSGTAASVKSATWTPNGLELNATAVQSVEMTNSYISLDEAKAKGTALASIPEPATATLSLLALAGLAARRRRK